MRETLRDLRSSLRVLRRRPVHTGLAIVILALGLSASVAVFTYINGFNQPFPGADDRRLMQLFGVTPEEPYQNISYLDYRDYADGATETFEGVAATQPFFAASVRLETETDVAFLEAVSGNYFPVLGIEMLIGRGLAPDDDRPGAPPAAVLSYAWWQSRFGGDRGVLGSTIYLNYRPFTVVGVASPDFLGAVASFRPHVWIPLAPFSDRYVSWTRRAENRDIPLVRVYGRLRPDADAPRALGELQRVAAGLDDRYPGREAARALRVEPATWIDPRSRREEQATLRMMTIAAAGLLLLVCANVANLLLAIAAGRRREMAVRAAIGATPMRLLRQMLAENVLLALVAGGVALALAGPASARLGSYFARPSVWGENVPRVTHVDLAVIGFTLVVALATGVLAGLLPAIRSSSRGLVTTLKSTIGGTMPGPRVAFGRRMPALRDALVTVQVALSVILLVVAGLVLRTLATARGTDPGFRYEQLVASHISTSSTGVEVADRDRFFRETAERLTAEPWVRSATVASSAPLTPQASAEFRLDGQEDGVTLAFSRVLPGFFETMDIPLVRGRAFSVNDDASHADVAIVNERLARRYFADAEPLGRRVTLPGMDGTEDRTFEIVGVVGDARLQDFLSEPDPMIYLSSPQHPYGSGSALVVFTAIDPAAAVPRLHRWLREWEPHLAIVNVLPYSDVVRGFLYTQRMNAELFAALAVLGLVLATVGLFSIMSLAVGQRTREIGVRMALGARRADIGGLVIRKALGLLAVGLVVGLAAASAVTRLARGLLYGVEPTDPTAVGAGVALMAFAAVAAAWLPARRAAALDPMDALRDE